MTGEVQLMENEDIEERFHPTLRNFSALWGGAVGSGILAVIILLALGTHGLPLTIFLLIIAGGFWLYARKKRQLWEYIITNKRVIRREKSLLLERCSEQEVRVDQINDIRADDDGLSESVYVKSDSGQLKLTAVPDKNEVANSIRGLRENA